MALMGGSRLVIDYLRESKFLKAISNLLSGGFKDRRFLAKLYYHQDDERQEEKAVDFVDFVLIPDDIVSRKKLQQRYDDKKYIPSSEEAVKFKESTIKLELESMADSETENGWKITPLKKMEVPLKQAVDSGRGLGLYPRRLKMTWEGTGDPQPLDKRLVLHGTKGSKFLTISFPPRHIPLSTQDPTTRHRHKWLWLLLLLAALFGMRNFELTDSLHLLKRKSSSIISLEILIDDLPEITNTARLCHCMRLDKRLCDKIEQEMQGDLWKQTREIAAAWFDRHIEEPSWEEIINILVCMNKVHDAKKIADKRGIKFKKALFHPQH